MKTRITLLLLFIFQIQSFSSFSKETKVDFLITVSAKLLKGSCLAIQFSNQAGEQLHHEITKDWNEEEDVLIQFKKEETEKVSVTLFFISVKNYSAVTYVNIENGSYIDTHSFYKLKSENSISLDIEGVNNVKDFHTFCVSDNRKIFTDVELEILKTRFKTSSDNAIFCLVKSNAERKYRYFYDENDSEKKYSRSFDENFLELPTITNNKKIFLPKTGKWSGKISTQIKGDSKPFFIYNNIATIESEDLDVLDLKLPTGEFLFTHINLKTSGLAINKIYEKIPSKIIIPEIEMNLNVTDQVTLDFSTSDNIGFYIAEYLFYSEEKLGNYPIGSRWNFVGIDKNVKFDIPDISNEIFATLKKLPFSSKPVLLKLSCYHVENDDPYDTWILPQTLLKENWQKENGVIIFSKSFSFIE